MEKRRGEREAVPLSVHERPVPDALRVLRRRAAAGRRGGRQSVGLVELRAARSPEAMRGQRYGGWG